MYHKIKTMSNKYELEFKDIFQEEGLYKSESFANGVAFKIQKNSFTDDFEIYGTEYESANSIMPLYIEPLVVYSKLFDKKYAKVFNRNQLFVK